MNKLIREAALALGWTIRDLRDIGDPCEKATYWVKPGEQSSCSSYCSVCHPKQPLQSILNDIISGKLRRIV